MKLTTKRIEKMYFMIRDANALNAKIAKELNRGNGHGNGVVLAKKAKKSHASSSARQAHGKYLGLIRHLTKGQRKAISKTRKAEGVNAAIAAARKLNVERQKSA